MEIVILDGYTENPGDLSWEAFSTLGEVTYYDRTKPNEIETRIKNADLILLNKTKFGKDEIDKAPKLKYIGILATGYDVVDVDYARKKGITVTNIPTYGTDSVAQMCFAMILEIYNAVGIHNAAVKKGEWVKCEDFCFWKTPLTELAGKTIGIVGFGRIGQKIAEIADAFDMKIIANDVYKLEKVNYKNFEYGTIEKLFTESDIVTLHCNLNVENREFINKELLKSMKSNAILINTSRGGLIKEEDLIWAIESNVIAGAALDVISKEPMEANHPFLTSDRIIVTPHISWATYEARNRLMDIAFDNMKSFLSKNTKNSVN